MFLGAAWLSILESSIHKNKKRQITFTTGSATLFKHFSVIHIQAK